MKAYKVVERLENRLKSTIEELDYGPDITTIPYPGTYLFCFSTVEDALEYLNHWKDDNFELWECEVESDGYKPEIYRDVDGRDIAVIGWDIDSLGAVIQSNNHTSWSKTLFVNSCRLTRQIPLKYFSMIFWENNTLSTDRHQSLEQAKCVVRKLQKEGMALEGKIFPNYTEIKITV